MPRKKKAVESALKKKGFKLKEGHHHYFIYHTIAGKKTTIKTKTSHTPSMKEIPDNLLSQMAKQCRLKKDQFFDLLDCPLEQKGYEEILRENNISI